MTFNQLTYFLVIKKYMNFTAAAEELCISQPSLSRHIQALEQEIGASLFDRTSRNITLTPAGEEFSGYADIFMDNYNKMLKSMQNYSAKAKRSITLASVPVMSLYRITEMITAFMAAYPDINIEILEAHGREVIWSLENHKADIGFYIHDSTKPIDFKLYPLLDDEMVMIVGKSNRFAGRESISLAEASNEDYLLWGNGSDVYNFAVEQCMKTGFYPRTVNTERSNISIETIADLVSKNFGVSLVILKSAMHFSYYGFKIVRLAEKPMLHSALITRNEPLSRECKTFIRFAADFCAKWDKDYKEKQQRLLERG